MFYGILEVCIASTVTMAAYMNIIESPRLPGDDNKYPLTIMGLFPMFGTSWPAGWSIIYEYHYIYKIYNI